MLKELVNQKEAYFSQGQEDAKEYTPDFEQIWDENSYMKVFSNQNEVLTISYENDGFSGGAHGYYNILFKNFDLKTNAVIQLSDIFKDIILIRKNLHVRIFFPSLFKIWSIFFSIFLTLRKISFFLIY